MQTWLSSVRTEPQILARKEIFFSELKGLKLNLSVLEGTETFHSDQCGARFWVFALCSICKDIQHSTATC